VCVCVCGNRLLINPIIYLSILYIFIIVQGTRILIKNNKTRKIIQNSQRELKNVPIHDVKNALIKNNLLKLGSTAPSNILRKIFEESNMTGEILNTGGDTFMHNYMNDNEKRKF
jgi:hypothetical protein